MPPFAVVDRRRVDADGNARFPEPEPPKCKNGTRLCKAAGRHRVCGYQPAALEVGSISSRAFFVALEPGLAVSLGEPMGEC